MSGFDSDWLALREPADHRTRSAVLLDKLPAPAPAPATATDALAGSPAERRIIDLGTGTGSNLRYLLPHLGFDQEWLLIDNDPALLNRLPEKLQAWCDAQGLTMTVRDDGIDLAGASVSARISLRPMDLAGDLGELALRAGDLVTCSALLDLFSTERLHALADTLCAAGCGALFALSYDGRVDWSPPLPFDRTAIELLNAHQRRDKGLGGAAGPDAGGLMVDALLERGHRVTAVEADWQLDADDATLQRELLAGWATAIAEIAPEHSEALQHWRQERHRHIDAGTGRVRVGHLDLVAVPGQRAG